VDEGEGEKRESSSSDQQSPELVASFSEAERKRNSEWVRRHEVGESPRKRAQYEAMDMERFSSYKNKEGGDCLE